VRPNLLRLSATLTLAIALAASLSAAADGDAPPGPFGKIARKDGKCEPYALSSDDALWAARMIVGESGGEGDQDDAAVLWCMINSYTLRPVKESYPTFTAFVRGYCTPLQPYLKSQGAIDRHKKLGTPMVEVEPGKWQLKRHVELQQKPWKDLPEKARRLVESVLTGKSPSPCGNSTQFCCTATYFRDKNGRKPSDDELTTYTEEYARSKKYEWFKVDGASMRSNCFFVEERFSKLPAGVVVIQK
jgi:hypothetical protein